jgi:uncharacterized protein (TIGR02118 family)
VTSRIHPEQKGHTVFKIVFLTKRKPGLTLEEYLEHYRTVHYPLAAALPGLISYEQQPLDHSGWKGVDDVADYDALSTYTFESKEIAVAAYASPAGLALEEDTGVFIDWPTVKSIPVTVTKVYRAD